MSTQQVDRLQALLEKVKQNRNGARPAAAASPASPVSPARAAAAPAAPAPRAAAPAPAPAPVAAKKPAVPSHQQPTTPVGMPTPARRAPAVEDELDFSSLPPPGASRAPAQEPAFTPAERRARPGATPLELAVEDTLDRPAVSPVVSPANRVQTAPVTAPAQPAAAPAAPAQRRDGVVLADPTPAQPARPIAQVLSKQAPIVPTSFGDLLKRSLSLRPR